MIIRRALRVAIKGALALLGLAATAALAQDAKTPPKTDPTQACATCHGADGNSSISAFPSLAGQHRAYILKQLQDFKSGERKNAIMGPIASVLSPEEMKTWADFFSKQVRKPRAAANAALVAAGQKIYRGGISTSGIPACAACHSPNGAGIPTQYPRLASQHAEYIAAQLRAFRAEERGNDVNRTMRTISSKMTDQEMQAVAEYISGLR